MAATERREFRLVLSELLHAADGNTAIICIGAEARYFLVGAGV